MEHFIITISRAYGSGGSIIGKCIAEKLGIACYDRSYIDRIAFVGRCADYVLREKNQCLNVWIGADEGCRTLRLYDDYWIRTGSLADKLRIVDKGRASYYKRCTGREWGEHYNYHIHLDSGAIGIDGCSDIICSTIQKDRLTRKE